MGNNKIISAIDLGTSKIVTIVGFKENDEKPNILAYNVIETKGMSLGLIQNINIVSDKIINSVHEVEEKIGVQLKEVIVGISGQQLQNSKNRGWINLDSYDHRIEEVDINKLTSAMHSVHSRPEHDLIEVYPQYYSLENEHSIRNPTGLFSRSLEGTFYVVAGDIFIKQNINECLKLAGLKLKKIVLEPVASANSVLGDNEKEEGAILIDLGAETTNLTIYQEGMLKHIAMIPFGSNLITKDIKDSFNISWTDAEKIKINHGKIEADQKIQLPEIIQARVEEILGCVLFELGKTCIKKKLGIVITGGGALLENLENLIHSKTNMDVRIGYPKNVIEKYPELNYPMYSSSIGLIMNNL